jgi:peptidyl-tRNA hydrolase, PTH1 family
MTDALLIVGLGNPGRKYEHTRHNIGFRVLDALHRESPEPFGKWKPDPNDVSRVASREGGTPVVVLLKPSTYMNNSGDAVSRFLSYYKLPPNRLWVVHDDLDLQFGELKANFNRGDAGHQGVASIIQKLGTKEFNRLRIGIGSNKPLGIPAEDYVLQKFSKEEERAIEQQIIPDALSMLQKLKTDFLKVE